MINKVWVILEREDYVDDSSWVVESFARKEDAYHFYNVACSIERNGKELSIRECDVIDNYTKPIFCLELREYSSGRYGIGIALYSGDRELEVELNRKWFKSNIRHISIPLKHLKDIKNDKEIIEKYETEIDTIKYAVRNYMGEKGLRVLIETLFFL
ncbi:hypothetical protein [Metaclostridioides mangenotii]|uniref:hypothetical protein n=1 Tax=Metaclostridioides mangenotii TaxID=1540 RepID=UPI0004844B79|nr:hypothetical protein [Clostridioides mangenotii]